MNTLNSEHPYDQLTPDLVLDAVESTGIISDFRILALNSYENRVYQVGREDNSPIIVKFYRPFRWSNEAILEEHTFTRELLAQELSVISPLVINNKTLHHFQGFEFAIFPRQGGHAPEVDNEDTLFRIGRNIGRLHQVGSSSLFKHRKSLSIHEWATDSRAYLLDHGLIPSYLKNEYADLTQTLIAKIKTIWSSVEYQPIRLHGDCHLGNILWREDQAHFVDFDDCMNGPAIQDLWLLLSGDRHQQTKQLTELIEGYEEFFDFDRRQLKLIESLRTLRMIYYAAWLGRRWEDPAFPMHFTWYNTEKYWSEHILELREQIAMLEEPALSLSPL